MLNIYTVNCKTKQEEISVHKMYYKHFTPFLSFLTPRCKAQGVIKPSRKESDIFVG